MKISMKRLSFLLLGAWVVGTAAPSAEAALCTTCAYVTSQNHVYAWDATANTMTLVATLPSNVVLDSLIFDKDGNIIADNDTTVFLYNTTTLTLSTLATGLGNSLADFAMEPSGQSILVASRDDNTIYRLNLQTKATSVLYHGVRPDGLIYDNAGRLFAVLGQNSVAQLNPVTGAVIKQITGVNGADGLTYSTTTLKLYVGSYTGADQGGFYTIPTDLSTKSFTPLSGRDIDGVGTAGDYLYLISFDDVAIKYNLVTKQVEKNSQHLPAIDDISPLSGFGSLVSNPPPVLSSLSPSTKSAGSAAFTLTLNGANFVNGATAMWNGTARPTTFVSAAVLTAQISATDVAAAGAVNVSVTNPDSQSSSSLPFTITSDGNTGPTLSRIDITPQNPSVGLHSQIQFFAQGYDTQGNAMTGLTYTWSTGNPANTINSTGLFSAEALGTDVVTVFSGSVHNATPVTVTAPIVISVRVTPLAAYRHPGQTISFTAQAYDQNNQPINTGGNFTWSLPQNQSGATITSGGVYTAGSNGLPATDVISASINNVEGIARVTVDNPGGNLTIRSVTANPNPSFGTSTQLHVDATGPAGETLAYQWSRVSGPAAVVFNPVTGADSSAAFSTPGVYVLQVKVTSSGGLTLTGSVSVSVVRTVTRIAVTPDHGAIHVGETLAFDKHVYDQFDQEMPGESVTWSSSAGSAASISAAGTFYSPHLPPQVTITATSVSRPTVTGTANIQVQGAGPADNFDITDAYAYPVPWKSTMPVPFITFSKLATDTQIRIFTPSGRLVRTLHSADGRDTMWYINNDSDERVASGVYFYVIDNDHSHQHIKGKLVVIK